MRTDRHAYLIMAHNQPFLLNVLLKLLDHERCDIYLHLDAKATINPLDVGTELKHSRLFHTERTDVHWGGYSQIEAELLLLSAAVKRGPYAYYHLLTGVDLPLKKQRDILEFFDNAASREFISLDQWRPKELERVVYRYPYQDKLYRGFIEKKVRRIGLIFQRLFKIKRMLPVNTWGIGSAYFDITESMARLIISKRAWIEETFKESFCADELFVQTIWLNFGQHLKRFHSVIDDNLMIDQTYKDVLRAIDWHRGFPYVFRSEDVDVLLSSDYLFARKFDESVDRNAITMIANSLTA